LVQTVDFFTPVVDDPFTSDKLLPPTPSAIFTPWAANQSPLFPSLAFRKKGDPAILEQIIRGGLDKMKEANCTVIGGHSIRNDDIQFGYAVTGTIHPKKIWRNVGDPTE